MGMRLGIGMDLGGDQLIPGGGLPVTVTVAATYPSFGCVASISAAHGVTISANYPLFGCAARFNDTHLSISANYPSFAAGTIQVGDFLPPTVWLETRFTSSVTLNGSTVSAMADQGSAGLSFAQGTPGNQPTWNASSATFNNKPSISFVKASTTFLRASPGVQQNFNKPGTMVWAFKFTGTTGTQEDVWDTNGGARAIFFIATTGVWEVNAGATANSTFSNAGPMVFVWDDTGTTSAQVWDNVSGSPVTVNAGTSLHMDTPFTLGASNGGTLPIDMEFVGFMYFTGVNFTNAQVAAIMAYFSMIYGISAS